MKDAEQTVTQVQLSWLAVQLAATARSASPLQVQRRILRSSCLTFSSAFHLSALFYDGINACVLPQVERAARYVLPHRLVACAQSVCPVLVQVLRSVRWCRGRQTVFEWLKRLPKTLNVSHFSFANVLCRSLGLHFLSPTPEIRLTSGHLRSWQHRLPKLSIGDFDSTCDE